MKPNNISEMGNMAFKCKGCGHTMNVMYTPDKCSNCSNRDVSKFDHVEVTNISP